LVKEFVVANLGRGSRGR